jgi:head-tail adaptor
VVTWCRNMANYSTLAELQQDVPGETNDDGHNLSNWTTQSKAWGQLTQLSSGEDIVGNQKRAVSTYSFETWYQPGLKLAADWRLKIGERLLYIAGPPNNINNRNAKWMLTVEERT